MRPHRLALLLFLGCLAPLTACGPGDTHPAGPLPDAVVSGVILFPPHAGTATLTSGVGPEQVKVLTAEVDATGGYALTLPASSPVPGVASSGLPATLWQSDMPLFCQGKPVLSDPAAQWLVVDGGFYSVAGRRIGDLLPQASALVDGAGTVATLKLLVHVDRPAAVQGVLKCAVGSEASKEAAQVTLDYRFERGWNTVILRSELTSRSGELNIRGTAGPPQGTTWKFLPTAP